MSSTTEATATRGATTTAEPKLPKSVLVPEDFPDELVCPGCGQTVAKADFGTHFFAYRKVEGAVHANSRHGCRSAEKGYRQDIEAEVKAGTRTPKTRGKTPELIEVLAGPADWTFADLLALNAPKSAPEQPEPKPRRQRRQKATA